MGEIAVRTALGASRRRIVAQLFVEALVLSSVAAVIGLGLASFAMEQMYQVLLSAGAIPFWITPGLSLGAEIYVVVLTIVAAVIAGVVPALRATSDRMLAGLRQLGGGTGIRLGATSTGLVAAQVAFAVAILPPVIFQGSEVIPDAATTPGFPAHEFLSARLAMDRETPPTAKVESYEREFTSRYAVRQTELVNRLKATPGVAAVSVAWTEPGGERTAWIEIDGLAAAPTDAVSSYAVGSGKSGYEVRFGRVDPAFFEVFDIPLVAGRRFNSIDMRATTMVVVNRSFVREFLQGGNALGRRLRYVGRSEDATPEDVE